MGPYSSKGKGREGRGKGREGREGRLKEGGG